MVGILCRAICIGKLLAPNLVPRILQERGFQNNYKEPGPSFSPKLIRPARRDVQSPLAGGGYANPAAPFNPWFPAGRAENRHSGGRCAMRCLRVKASLPANASPMRNALAICILLFAVFPIALPAQQSSSSSGATPGWPMHNSAPLHGLPDAVGQMPQTAPQKNGSCLLWVVAEATGNTVSAATLQIPGKAHGEYEKGCGDLRDRKIRRRRKSPAQSGSAVPALCGSHGPAGQSDGCAYRPEMLDFSRSSRLFSNPWASGELGTTER